MDPGISQVTINEVVASNPDYYDEDNDTPDWFEMYNASSDSINLYGYSLSEDKDKRERWVFENTFIGPKDHLVIFASGKNRKTSYNYHTIISVGDRWKYHIPHANTGANWKQSAFNDSDWPTGTTGIGYGDGDDATVINSGTVSVYLRKKFNLSSLEDVFSLILHVDYDDAFVAYLNGNEVARSNIGRPGQLTEYNARASGNHEALMYSGQAPDAFIPENAVDFLIEGENVLAIQAHNVSNTSSDLTIIPFLTLQKKTGTNQLAEELNLFPPQLHTDFKIAAEGEQMYLFDPENNLVDSIILPAMPSGVSYGRKTDGDETFVFFATPTADQPNGGIYYEGIITDTVKFSLPGGIYKNNLNLSLSGTGMIRYTLDGSLPSPSSSLYTETITIDQNMTVRANIFKPDFLSRNAVSEAYLINMSHDIPVISLAFDPKDFWDDKQGIYTEGPGYSPIFPHFGSNFWNDWERALHLTYFDEQGNKLFDSGAGVKIFGGWSRGFDQRSLSLFARGKYGSPAFEFPFFHQRVHDSYQALVLRNSGNDWNRTMLRDAVLTSLVQDEGLDIQAYQPVACYLNGEYWGMYNLREKINEHYLAINHNTDPDQIDLLQNDGQTIHGNNEDYIELRSFISDNSLVNEANYQFVIGLIDERNFIKYQVAQIFFDNTDWPGNNNKFWKTINGKWKWILFDTDFGFGVFNKENYKNNTLDFALEPNGPGWPNPPWSTLFLRKLINNKTFKNQFINYFADALNSYFLPDIINARIDAAARVINKEVRDHLDRWSGSLADWHRFVSNMKFFADQRPAYARNFLQERFRLSGQYLVTIENPEKPEGYVQINSLQIIDSLWSGIYFGGNQITISAHPRIGFEFSHWSRPIYSEESTLHLDLNKDITLTPHFKTTTKPTQQIVINEINYHSPDSLDAGDWIEIHNVSDIPVNMSNWVLKDDDDTHEFRFPEGFLFEEGGFKVIVRDSVAFSTVHPNINQYLGTVDYGFSSSGDQVRLYDHLGILHDSVHYLPSMPWPTTANGEGPTLELIDPGLDNTRASSWIARAGIGTPGKKNQIDKVSHPIIINEINYQSADSLDSGDWIELHNYGENSINISNWVFRDEDESHSFTFPTGTVMEANSYLVLVNDVTKFNAVFSSVQHYPDVFDFGLSSSGEVLRLFDDLGLLQDTVHYLPDAPWPFIANGFGPSLELKDPKSDNALAKNWMAVELGSPGLANSSLVSTVEPALDDFVRIYPNPSNGVFQVNLTDVSYDQLLMEIFDIGGRKILEEIHLNYQATLVVNLGRSNGQLYVLRLTLDDQVVTKLIVVNK